ncbi:TPA: N4-gp56 family major capsid protein, partial [Streptococcus pyogenes]
VGTTKMAQMLDPEVLADMIDAEVGKAIRFAPLAEVDTTLEGQPGTTLTVPKWDYIGDAEDVAEGEAIPMTQLGFKKTTMTIKKAGKGVEITDEAILSGYG